LCKNTAVIKSLVIYAAGDLGVRCSRKRIKKMDQIDEMITAYDEEAEATGWYGPEVAFGLT